MLYSTIAFFLVLIPFLTLSNVGDGFRIPKEIATIFGFMAVIAMSYLYNRKTLKARWLMLFLIWCFLASLFNNYYIPVYMPNVIVKMPCDMFMWKSFFYITLAIFTMYSLACVDFKKKFPKRTMTEFDILYKPLNDKSIIRGLSNGISICLIIMCSYTIIQAIGFDDFFMVASQTGHKALGNLDPDFSFSHRIVGTLGNPSLLAIWVVMCLPFTIYLRNKIGYTALALSIISLYFTMSATAIIAGIVGTFFYIFFKSKKIFVITLILLILFLGTAYLIIPSRNFLRTFINPTGRIETHKEAWNTMQGRVLLGLGLGTFEYIIGLNPAMIEKLKNEKWRSLHNELGQIWFAVGLIGLIIFLIFIFSVFRQFLFNVTNESLVLASSLVIFLVTCLTLFPMRLSPNSYYAVVFTGLLMNLTRRKN